MTRGGKLRDLPMPLLLAPMVNFVVVVGGLYLLSGRIAEPGSAGPVPADADFLAVEWLAGDDPVFFTQGRKLFSVDALLEYLGEQAPRGILLKVDPSIEPVRVARAAELLAARVEEVRIVESQVPR